MFTATSPEDLPDRDALLAMSGLAFMQGMLKGEIARPPISVAMNFTLDDVAAGEVRFRGAPTFDSCNPMGTVHGGWYGTLLDSCMACAVMTTVPQGSIYTTLEFKVNLTRNLLLGTEVIATGRVDHAGKTTGVATGELRGVDDGKLYATGSTTCLIMTIV